MGGVGGGDVPVAGGVVNASTIGAGGLRKRGRNSDVGSGLGLPQSSDSMNGNNSTNGAVTTRSQARKKAADITSNDQPASSASNAPSNTAYVSASTTSAPHPAQNGPSFITATNGSQIEVIDLTLTPPPGQGSQQQSYASASYSAVVQAPAAKRRRKDNNNVSAGDNISSYNVNGYTYNTGYNPGATMGNYLYQQQQAAAAAAYFQPPPPPTHPHMIYPPSIPKPLPMGVPNYLPPAPMPAPAPPLPPGQSPYDDKEGHYIVNINEDLTPRYKILRLLGQGTFGKVVEAYDRNKKTRVAIKIIRAVQKYRDASKIEIKVLNALKDNDPYNTK
jgi:hypothetical protein